MAEKAEEENTETFRAEVEKEFVFLKSFPVLDDWARKEAEKEREILKKKLRDLQREYNGPPLISDTAIQAENDRLMKLQKEFNKIAARWSRIRQEANIKYLGWSNPKLENMFKEAKEDLVHEDFNHIELKDSIANAEGNNMKFRNYGKTGSGNGFENPPQSTTTTTNPQK
jgi:hypothetical protein